MATTVGQHSVATFTSPVNGTTPIDANTVRGNDNVMRTAYVDHDADPGIHVQSSTIASRPVAGTTGRKWITEDDGIYTLWFDDGTNWHPVSSEAVAVTVLATQTLAKGDVVKVTGWNNGQNLAEVAKVSSSTDVAFAVMSAACTINTMGYATNTGILHGLATNTFNVGDILYPSTSGGFTATKPTSGNYQPCGFVLRSNPVNGVIYVEFSTPRIVERSDNTASTLVLRDASGNFSAGTITANLTGNISGTAPAGTLTGTTLASNVVSSSLTSVGTISSGTWQGTAIANSYIATGLDVTKLTTGTTLPSNVVSSSLTSVGTLSSLTVSGNATFANTNTVRWNDSGGTVRRIITTSASDFVFLGDIDYAMAANQTHLRGTTAIVFGVAGSEQGRLTSTGLGVGTSSPGQKLDVSGADGVRARVLATVGGTSGLILSSAGNTAYAFKAGNGDNSLRIDQDGTDRVWLASGGNFGLGVTPTEKLDVYANANSQNVVLCRNADTNTSNYNTQAYFRLDVAGNIIGGLKTTAKPLSGLTTPALYLTTAGAYPIAFGINNSATPSAILDSSGNLGLGVTPNTWISTQRVLELGRSGSRLTANTSTGDINIGVNAYNPGSGNVYANTGSYAPLYQITASGGSHVWYTAPSGTAGNAITFTQAMTLDASGRLGIGVTSPGVALDVTATTGCIRLISSTGTNQVFSTYENTGGTLRVGIDSSAGGVLANGTAAYSGVIATIGAQPLAFGTNTTERARIDSSGNLLVGTTSGTARLTVAASAASTNNGIDILRNGYTARFRLGSQGATDADFWITNNYNPSTGAAESAEAGTIKLAVNNTVHILTNTVERIRVKSTGQMRFVPLAADPAGAENGDVYYNSTTNKLRVYAGGAWVDLH